MEAKIIIQNLDEEFYTNEKCHIIELSNDSNDPEVSIARARVEPGVTTTWHRLKGTTERYHIVQGQGQIEVGDLAPQEISVGDTVIIPPMCPQRITNTGDVNLIFLAICTPPFDENNYDDIEDLKGGLLVEIKYSDLEDAYMYANAGGATGFETVVYIHKETGKMYYHSDYDDGLEEEKLPSDIGGDIYASVPQQRDLNLGRHLVFQFVSNTIPEHLEKVEDIFRKRGAYGRYKDFLDNKNALDKWDEFENNATRNALEVWARDNGFEVVG